MAERRFDPLALLAGLLFAGIGVAGLGGGDTIADHLEWLWPLLFVVLGAGFLAAAARRAAVRNGNGDTVEDTTTFL